MPLEGINSQIKWLSSCGLFFGTCLEYEPAQLLLGSGIGIVIVVILIKKIINRKNKK